MNEFRHQPLYDQWVIIAPNRVKKPWIESKPKAVNISKSPFLPNEEHKTPPEIYAIRDDAKDHSSWKTRVFANKFPLLALESPAIRTKSGGYSSIGGFGAHEMIIDSRGSLKPFGKFGIENIANLMLTIKDRITSLYQDIRVASVSIFKNDGIHAGNTIEHSHSQIVALPIISPRLNKIINTSRAHYNKSERCLLCDLISDEEEQKSRIVYKNSHFVAFAPYAARYEFEVWIAPLNHTSDYAKLSRDGILQLADVLHFVLSRIDTALESPDINMLLHTVPPVRDHKEPDYFHHLDRFFHWHIELLPRLYSEDGFELSTECFVNPIAPEEYAEFLRTVRTENSTTKE